MPERMAIVYPGVDTEKFRPAIRQAGKTDLICGKYFLHVGVLRERKNPEGLLRAFREVADKVPDVHLVCVGPYQTSAAAAKRVTTLSSILDVESKLHLLGDCSDETLVELYRGAVGLVFPSFYEGFGFPVVESLACGTPCLTSNVSSLSEVGGNLAVYVEPGDYQSIARGMFRLLDDDNLKTTTRVAGPPWAARFDAAVCAANTVRLYRSLASERN
jgi:glycosyltransferase involved in cell wall biosynthesis